MRFRSGGTGTFVGEKWLKDLVAHEDDCGEGSEAIRMDVVTPGSMDFFDESFGSELPEVISDMGWTQGWGVEDFGDEGDEVGEHESVRTNGECDNGEDDGSHSGLFDVDASDVGSANGGWAWEIFKCCEVDERSVDGSQDGDEVIDDVVECQNNLGESVNALAAVKVFDVVSNGFDAEHAFAFAVHLDGEPAHVELEHSQIPDRSLDHSLASRQLAVVIPVVGTPLQAEDFLDGFDVEGSPSSVDDGLENLLHGSSLGEKQVATVLGLADRVGIVEDCPSLFVDWKGEQQAGGIDPTLADLDKAPYRALAAQGVCDTRQACGVGNIHETVSIFDEGDVKLLSLSGHEFMAVQNDEGIEGRMRAEPNDHVTPLLIHDVKRIVVYGRHGIGLLEDVDPTVPVAFNIEDGCRCTSDDNAKKANEQRIRWLVRIRQFMLALVSLSRDDRNPFVLREGTNAACKPVRKPNQMSLVQCLVSAHESSPPRPETTSCLDRLEIREENDAVNAIVGAVQKVAIRSYKRIRTYGCFAHNVESISANAMTRLPRRGPLAWASVPGKA